MRETRLVKISKDAWLEIWIYGIHIQAERLSSANYNLFICGKQRWDEVILRWTKERRICQF